MEDEDSVIDMLAAPFADAPDGATNAQVGQAGADEVLLASLAAYVESQAGLAPGATASVIAPTSHGGEGRRGGVMNEVFVLGKLMARPLHGYVLRQIMSVALGPVRQMNWNTLYPLIHRLVEEGLLEPVDATDPQPVTPTDAHGEPSQPEDDAAPGEGGRRRKAYRITPAGRARFQELMQEQEGYTPDYPDLFNIKLSNFAYTAPTTRLATLRHYQGYLQLLSDYLRAIYTNSGTSAGIPDSERPFIRRMIQHRWYLTQADLRWIGEVISLEIMACADAVGADAAVATAR